MAILISKECPYKFTFVKIQYLTVLFDLIRYGMLGERCVCMFLSVVGYASVCLSVAR